MASWTSIFGSAPLQRLARALRLEADWQLLVVAAVLGILMGALALAFILPIRWLEGQLEHAIMDAGNAGTAIVVVAPVLGAIGTVLVQALIPVSFRGHGVTQVLYAVNRAQSRIPMRVAARQWLASSCTIASGGSAGPEGPIVTIGATIGSNAARLVGPGDAATTTTLLGCGAAAGLAAVFAAPLTGIFFVLEVLLRDFSARTFAPIVTAAVLSIATVQTIMGSTTPLFGTNAAAMGSATSGISIASVPAFILVAGICAVGAVFFMRTLEFAERGFTALPLPRRALPLLGAAILGIGGAVWLSATGMRSLPPFFGSGYWVVHGLLAPQGGPPTMAMAGMLVAWFAAKCLATGSTIGSGNAGGLFAPSLVAGAMLGGAIGQVLGVADLGSAPLPALVLAGMGCMVAATTHAPLAGAMLVYELSRDETIIMPVLLATVVSTLACRAMHPLSMYTSGLAALGVRQGAMADLALLRRVTVGGIGHLPGTVLLDSAPGTALVELADREGVTDAVVVDAEGRYRGIVTAQELQSALLAREALAATTVADLMRTDLPTTSEDETLDVAFHKLSARSADAIAVVQPRTRRLLGILTRERLMQAYGAELDRMG